MSGIPLAPVFVFGALRSGTTLFRLMLNSHDGIGNPGEVDFLFDCLAPDATHPTGWRYDLAALRASRIFRAHGLDLEDGLDGLDLLQNLIGQFRARTGGVLTMNVHRHAARILAVLPDARFIHLLRDPRDVARSSIGMGWAGISYYGIDHWIGTERSWDEAASRLGPDQLLSLQFESLMADIEIRLEEVCVFLEVPFAAGMLEYHRNTTYGPPDPKIAEQWRAQASAYEIALLEGKCGALMVARGYAPNGEPRTPGTAETIGLALWNRVLRWRSNIRKVGLPLFFSEKLSRWLRLHGLHARVRRRIDEKIVRVLK